MAGNKNMLWTLLNYESLRSGVGCKVGAMELPVSKSTSGFDCRFEFGSTLIVLTRHDMPPQTLEVCVEYRLNETSKPSTVACGFSEFVENGIPPDVIVR